MVGDSKQSWEAHRQAILCLGMVSLAVIWIVIGGVGITPRYFVIAILAITVGAALPKRWHQVVLNVSVGIGLCCVILWVTRTSRDLAVAGGLATALAMGGSHAHSFYVLHRGNRRGVTAYDARYLRLAVLVEVAILIVVLMII